MQPFEYLAPRPGLEPGTCGLTAGAKACRPDVVFVSFLALSSGWAHAIATLRTAPHTSLLSKLLSLAATSTIPIQRPRRNCAAPGAMGRSLGARMRVVHRDPLLSIANFGGRERNGGRVGGQPMLPATKIAAAHFTHVSHPNPYARAR